MSRLWIEDVLVLDKCELVTLSITKNHRHLESPRLGRKRIIKCMLSLDPTEVMHFDDVVYFSVDLEACSSPLLDDTSNQTLTLPELSKSCTLSRGGGVAFRQNMSQMSSVNNEQLLATLSCDLLQFPKETITWKRKYQPCKRMRSFKELIRKRKDSAKLHPCTLSLIDNLFGDRA